MFYRIMLLLLGLLAGSSIYAQEAKDNAAKKDKEYVRLIVLGNVQDAGSPQIGCTKKCCTELFLNPDPDRKVTALGILDDINKKQYLFDATPDIASQLRDLKLRSVWATKDLPDGIFLTHAHIGHYTGLMYLGREATNANRIPVYAMSRMASFLSENGPWNQLLSLSNISIKPLQDNALMVLTNSVSVQPFTVPHRDEYSETVGFRIIGPSKTALFIPDIDKWHKWKKDIVQELKTVDYAFLDATFFDKEEINNRNIKEIPHPFVSESMQLFQGLSPLEKSKIYFIHLNHTNPLLEEGSLPSKQVEASGFHVARKGMVFKL